VKLLGHTVSTLLLAASTLCFAAAPEAPALPRLQVDTTMPASSGETIAVRAGGDFQAALERAKPGDIIELEAGAQFTGPFTLPKKQGDAWIVVRSSAHLRLPTVGTRVSPAHASAMPVLVAEDSFVIGSANGAHHYRFIGIEIRPQPGEFIYNLVELGNGNELVPDLPHHIIFERSYLHGDPKAGSRRGIAMNGAHMAVLDSWFSEFKEQGTDSQAIAGWSGPGPFLIRNNHLEAAGENIMFGGGGRPAIDNLIPSDIEVRGNHLVKSLSWKQDEPTFEGTQWTVKNLFELKNAQRVLVDGNVLENNWPQAQNGLSILFTVRNEDGAIPWATVADVTFTNNLVTGVAGGFNILGRDDNGKPSGLTERVVIRNNLFRDMGGKWGNAPLFQLLQGISDLAIEHNTAVNGATIIMSEGEPHTDVSFSNNIVKHNEYGIIGSGTGVGNSTLERMFPEVILQDNVIVGGEMRNYPEGNSFPVSETDVGFLDKAAGDFRLDPARSVRRGETTTGVDLPALCAALAPSERGTFCAFDATAAR
jgi:hypothetical protein